MVSLKIDTDKVVLGLDSLRDALFGQGQDASNVVQDEARLLGRTIVAFTPPLGSNARQQGENAIERDIKNLVSEASQLLIDEIGSKYGVHDITAAYRRDKEGHDINLQWENLDPSGARLAEYHKKYRNAKGRIPSVKAIKGVWRARVVVPDGVRAAFIADVQKHVGLWKASWAELPAKLGEKFPTWIRRHLGHSHGISDVTGLQNKLAPSVKFGSRAGGNSRIRSDIQAAVNARAKTIARRVKLILSGYNKDLARGMKAQSRAKDWSEPSPVIN